MAKMEILRKTKKKSHRKFNCFIMDLFSLIKIPQVLENRKEKLFGKKYVKQMKTRSSYQATPIFINSLFHYNSKRVERVVI